MNIPFETIRRRYKRHKKDMDAMLARKELGYQPKEWHKRYVRDVGALLQYYDELVEWVELNCEPD